SDISRAHQIRCPETGWWDIAGGKLTTYRLMAEQAVDQIVNYLGVKASACRTADEPLLRDGDVTPFSGVLPAPCARAAVEHYVRHEWARRLEDGLLRRSGWHYYQRWSTASVEQVAGWMGEFAHWSPAQRRAEIDAFCSSSRFEPAA